MIEHLVLFKFNDAATPDQKKQMIEGLRRLKSVIPGIVDLTVGENFTDRGKGFTCGLVVRLKDKEGLKSYQENTDHQHVLTNLIKPIVSDVVAVDYEI